MVLFVMRLVISTVATFLMWCILTGAAVLGYGGLYDPASIGDLLVALKGQLPARPAMGDLLARPLFWQCGLAVAGLIVMYQKFLLFAAVTLLEREQSRQ